MHALLCITENVATIYEALDEEIQFKPSLGYVYLVLLFVFLFPV